jgi:nucleoside-triphosphatase THEP1
VSETRFTFVTGPRDAGKTQTLRRLAEEKRRAGHRIGGVIAEAGLREGVKESYSFVDLATGERRLYAILQGNSGPGYWFLADGLAFGRAAMHRAVADGVDALFVDEVGPLEMAGNGLWEPLQEACADSLCRVFLSVRPGLLEECIARCAVPAGDLTVIRLSAAKG